MSNKRLIPWTGLFLLLFTSVYPQTWDGGAGNGNWNSVSNWNSNTSPSSSSTTAILFSGGTETNTNQNLGNSFQINSITFGSGMTAPFSISGKSFVLAGTTPSITQNSSFTGSIDNALSLSNTLVSGGTGSGTITLSGKISGSGGITKNGPYTLILSEKNSYSGVTTITNGTLLADNNEALGSTTAGTHVQSGGTLLINAGVSLQNNETITLAGTGFSSQGALANSGGSAGIDGSIALSSSATLTSTSGTFTLGDNATTDTVSLGSNTLTLAGSGDTFFNSNITGSGNVIKSGPGTVTYFGDDNTYTGTTTVQNGKLIVDTFANHNTGLLGDVVVGDGAGAVNSAILQSGANTSPVADEVIANTVNITIQSDGVWNLNAQTETVGSVGGSGNVQLGTGGSLITGGNNTSTTLSGTISGAGTFTKSGTGTMTLTGANTLSGATTINGGILAVSATNSLGSTSAVTINAGGTLMLSGTGISDRVNNAASVTLNGGTLASTGNLTETLGTLTLSSNSMIDMGSGSSVVTFSSISNPGSSILTVNNWTSGGTDRLIFSNTSGLTPAFLSQIQFSGYGVGATIIGNELVPISSAIPESDNLIAGLLVLLLVASVEIHRHQKKIKQIPIPMRVAD